MFADFGLTRLVAANLKDGFVLVDGHGRVREVNDALCAMTGRARDELIGSSPSLFLDEESACLFAAPIVGASVDLDLAVRRKDGALRHFKSSISPFSAADGSFDGRFALMREPAALLPNDEPLGMDERRRIAAEAAAGVGFDWDLRQARIERSAGLAELLGFEADEADPTHEWWLHRIHPHDVQAFSHCLDDVLNAPDRRLYGVEYRVLHKDGRHRWIHSRAAALRDENGRPYRVIGSHMDVTDRKLAESALRANEERLRAVFEQSTAGIAQLAMDGRFILVNQYFCDLLGREKEELLGLRMQDVTHPGDVARNLEAIERSKAGGGSYRIEKRYIRKDGSIIWADISSNIVRDADGGVTSVLGVITDITDRKLAEPLLHRDAMLLANVRDSVIVTDLEGVVTFWNEGATRLFGWTAEEMIGRPYADRLPEPSRGEVARWIGRIAAGGAEFSGEWMDNRKDGSQIWIEASTRRISDAEGNPVGIMGVSHDISDRKRAENDRDDLLARERAAHAEIERANQAKDEFLAVLSHELRTPLTPVLTSVQLMERDLTLTEEQRETVMMIRRNIELEARLIDDLLDLTRISRGKLELFLAPVDVHLKIQHVAAICDADLKSKRLHFTLDLGAAHPQVRADAARLQQALWNLLKNAVKFTPEGGAIAIRTRDAEPGVVQIQVVDTGCGIAPDVLPTIFDAFVQGGREVTRRHGGLGLGLAITKRLVEMHGGDLHVSSEGPGKGSVFTLALPTVLQAMAKPTDSTADGLPKAARSAHILLVEDNADTSKVMKKLLQLDGHRVRTADSVASALRAADAEPFDLLISDIGLPDGSGLDLMRQLRARRPVKAIALSGFGMEDDVRRSKEAGFAAHLTKPVSVPTLCKVIEDVLI